jgi:hypothetical protein
MDTDTNEVEDGPFHSEVREGLVQAFVEPVDTIAPKMDVLSLLFSVVWNALCPFATRQYFKR